MSTLKVLPELADYFRRNGRKEAFLYNNRLSNGNWITPAQYVVNHNWISNASGRRFGCPFTEEQYYIDDEKRLHVLLCDDLGDELVDALKWNAEDFARFIDYLQDQLELTIGIDLHIQNFQPAKA